MLADHVLPVFLCTCFFRFACILYRLVLYYTIYKIIEKEGCASKKDIFFK